MTYAIKLKGQTGDKAHVQDLKCKVKTWICKSMAKRHFIQLIPEDHRHLYEVVTYKKEERNV